MSESYKKRISRRDLPEDFGTDTIQTVARIEAHPTVAGIMFMKNKIVHICTVPETMAQTMITKLPSLNYAIHRALTEIVKLKKTLAEAPCGLQDLRKIMKIISNLLKDVRDEWLVNTTVIINQSNPIIDRIMEDDSVAGVIMTNKEGAPILTNISTTRATNYGLALQKFGIMAQTYVKELDTFDEVLVARIHTKKVEMMMAPHKEFNIIVMQHPRQNVDENKENIHRSNDIK